MAKRMHENEIRQMLDEAAGYALKYGKDMPSKSFFSDSVGKGTCSHSRTSCRETRSLNEYHLEIQVEDSYKMYSKDGWRFYSGNEEKRRIMMSLDGMPVINAQRSLGGWSKSCGIGMKMTESKIDPTDWKVYETKNNCLDEVAERLDNIRKCYGNVRG